MILEKLLIPGEDLAELCRLANHLTQTWQPDDLKEQPFVEQLIHHNWLLERLRASSRASGKVGQALSPAHLPFPKQTQFEAEIASWPEPKEEKQTQFEYPPIPKGANEANFPTPLMKQQADWRRYKK